MSEHALAGETVTLLIDGDEVECQLEKGISQEEGEKFINSMLGVDATESSPDVKHPDLEIAETTHPETKGLRTVCRIEKCEHTEVFDTLDDIKDSEWTELGLPKGLLTDRTDFHYAYCPQHFLSEDEGYDSERDMASHEFNGAVPNSVEGELDE